MTEFTRQVVLLRHGQTDWNSNGRIQGHTDTPLNDAGREQARALAAQLQAHVFCTLVSSDLSRARETAQILGQALGLSITLDAELRERGYGIFEGLTWPEAQETYARLHPGQTFVRTDPIPGAESKEALATRAVRALLRVAALSTPDRAVLVVTHGGVVQSLLESVLGPAGKQKIPNAQPFLFLLHPDGRREARLLDGILP